MSRFAKYTWFVTAFLVLVILWGAVVRATGSGAGCGNHWPLCDGEIIPQPETVERMIEFSHRVTSAISGVFVLVLAIWAFRVGFEHNQRGIRAMALMTLVFIIIEGGLGAALVRLELVADNSSSLRAIMVALHLANTLILLAFSTLTAWLASLKHSLIFTKWSAWSWGVLLGLVGYIILSSMGAITALGDTLFPMREMAERLAQDADLTTHFLVELRVWHPVVAIFVSVYLMIYGYFLRMQAIDESLERMISLVFVLIGVQIIAGFVNIALHAPVWMQIVHLFLADSLWIALIVFAGLIWSSEVKAKQVVSA